VLTSLRHISISYKGQEIAASDRWFALFEGSASGGKEYPLRYYIPKGDVKVTLQPSDTKRSVVVLPCYNVTDATYAVTARSKGTPFTTS
jgi:uncharacterized protein (DUF427 family)